jgi:hypothetical protein
VRGLDRAAWFSAAPAKPFETTCFSGWWIGGESVPGRGTGGGNGPGIKPSLFFCLFFNVLQVADAGSCFEGRAIADEPRQNRAVEVPSTGIPEGDCVALGAFRNDPQRSRQKDSSSGFSGYSSGYPVPASHAPETDPEGALTTAIKALSLRHDGSPTAYCQGINREHGADDPRRANAVAAPATVSGESAVDFDHWVNNPGRSDCRS